MSPFPLYLREEEIWPQGKSLGRSTSRANLYPYPCKCFATRKSLWHGPIDNSFLKRVDRFHRKRIIRRDGFPRPVHARRSPRGQTLPTRSIIHTPFLSCTPHFSPQHIHRSAIPDVQFAPLFFSAVFGGEEERKKKKRRAGTEKPRLFSFTTSSLPPSIDRTHFPVLHTKILASCFPRSAIPETFLKHR